MDLYAAIDLRGGRCVRLAQGDFGRETVYGASPVARAIAFEAGGAGWLHVVDLDAARTGSAVNRGVVAEITAAVHIPVQVGGGARSAEDVEELLELGAERVVVGTAAVSDPELFAELAGHWPGKVAAGVDHFEGEVRLRGWEERSGRHVEDVVGDLVKAGAAAVVVTEISRDGLMVGPDVVGYRSLLEATAIPLIASGGIGSLADLRRLAWLHAGGRHLEGVIVGRALYEGRFGLPEAVAACRAVRL